MRELDRMVTKAEKIQPECQGTIRFTLWPAFQQLLTKVRLHQLGPGQGGSLDENASALEFAEANRGLVQVAVAEIADWYAAGYGGAPSQAHLEAARAVNAVIAGAFNLCG